MKETVLLTGGAGFIGSHIAVELLQRDYDVVIADDLSNSRPDVPERIEKITGRAPVFYRMDVSDRQALDRVLAVCAPWGIVGSAVVLLGAGVPGP